MAKLHGFKYFFCLSSSLLVNLFFFINFFTFRERKLSWSKEAAVEAEVVSSLSCSGHGRAFLDGVIVGGKPVCECNLCYGGLDCSEFSQGCPADVDSGDPLFLEPFWMQHAASSALMLSGWHRMSYTFGGGSQVLSELERHIRQLHSVIGNAVTTGRYILYGAGSTQLLNAALYALSNDGSPFPAGVVASIPYYPVYKSQTYFYDSMDFKWQGDASLWKNKSDSSMNFIEFVTSPNNPDGLLKKPVLRGPSVKTINDHAYYWPHFTGIPAPADEDLMIFTLSKLTGHAGSRFGWALIKDEAVYERMSTYLSITTMGVSHDTKLRALKLLKVALEGKGRGLFEFSYKTMRNRWELLNKSLSLSKRFSIQNLEPQYCTYFQRVRDPSPAYAWLKCEREEDQDCFAVLKAAGIIGRAGTRFEAESRYTRLSLIKGQDDFDLLIKRIDALVSEESGAKII